MTTTPRILTIMGSGETSPTMVKVHRENAAAFGRSFNCVILDTPYGFQSNADYITARAVEYFKISLNIDAELASFKSALVEPLERDRFFYKLDRADYIFAGPGSPTYALRQWKNTPVPKVLTKKLSKGPAVIVFSSAAALTLGSHTIPVYETYKVGEEPTWVDGLDILGPFGINGAIIPHFNNSEGKNHDTRYCYLGKERLHLLESKLESGSAIYGIDEHTALTIDFSAESVRVSGIGTVTVRSEDRQAILKSGTELPLAHFRDVRHLFEKDSPAHPRAKNSDTPIHPVSDSTVGQSSLGKLVDALKLGFDQSISERNVDSAIRAILTLHSEIDRRGSDPEQRDEITFANIALHSMIVDMGEFARGGAREPKEIFGPYLDLILTLRLEARSERRWDQADRIRNALSGLGIEVRDIPGGSEWFSIGNPRATY